MKHIARVLILLGMLVAAFILVKSTNPPTFLKAYGFTWSENNAADWASRPMQYEDSSSCSSCHTERYQTWQTGAHSSVSCETCHGPSLPHVEAKAKATVDTSPNLCATCHAALPSRPKDFPQVQVGIHNGAAGCTSCHNPHKPTMFVRAPAPTSGANPAARPS